MKIPAHIAMIMDGNGRWALAKGLPRLEGHKAGAETIRRVLQCCQKAGVRYLTLYAFSSENWKRPKEEVDGLMTLFADFLQREEATLHQHQIRLRVIGERTRLHPELQHLINQVERGTATYRQQLILAVSYGGRQEILTAARTLASRIREGLIAPEGIDEGVFAQALYAPDVPDPDLIIRTSGEYRLSNFLLWQAAYSELYVTDCCWPDFNEAEFEKALNVYSQRERRFGGHA